MKIFEKIGRFIIDGPFVPPRTIQRAPTAEPKRAWTNISIDSIEPIVVTSSASSSSSVSDSTSQQESRGSAPPPVKSDKKATIEQQDKEKTAKHRKSKEAPSSKNSNQLSIDSIEMEKKINGTSILIENQETIEPKVFKKRWIMLVIFILLSGSNGAQWIQYSIIANIIVDYYGVSYQAVDWTSMIYMLTYIVFFIPAAWILDKWGLRLSVLLGALGNCAGAWIKLLSTHPSNFWVTFVGQSIVGASQMFTLGIPSRLAAVWFGPDEVSRACAAGVFGNQLGIAIGFVLPPLIVKNGTLDEITHDLNTLFLGSAIFNTFVFALVICFFMARPRVPPSLAQLTALEEKTLDNNFWSTLRKLICSRDFFLLFVTYGINTGVFYAISTLLSQMVLSVYPTESVAVGQIGLVIVLAGMLGSVVGGFLLDKFKRFKLTAILIYLFSFVGMTAFTITINLHSLVVVFIVAALLGFFMTGYLPIGFELAAEITYPASEGTTSGLLNASAQIFGILFTWLMGIIMHKSGTLTSNIIMTVCLFIGIVLTCFIREDLKRQKAHSQTSTIPTSETQLTSCTIQNEHF